MGRIRGRDALVALVIALFAGATAALPPFKPLRGWSIDALTGLRWRIFGNRFEPASSPTVVIALDEETYRTPPFENLSTSFMTGEIGRAITAATDGGARVVGLDLVFPTSVELSTLPYRESTLGALLSGFDSDFLGSLYDGGHAGKLVLGWIQLGEHVFLPAPAQRLAVGGNDNLRALAVSVDADEVVRRVPLTVMSNGKPVPAFALELAARALGEKPQLQPGQPITLDGYRVPTAPPSRMTVNFEGGAQDIPTYSLADLRACIERGDESSKEFFRRNFNGRVVILGEVQLTEDRKVTSKRFAAAPERPMVERCALPPPPATEFVARTIPGAYIHATAVNNLIRHDALIETGPLSTGIIAAAFATMPAFAALLAPPMAAAASFLVLAGAGTLAAVAAFQYQALVLPLSESLLAGLAALFIMIAFRLAVTDKTQRILRRSFSLYLAPAVIEKMLSSGKLPSLGGETRRVTMYFSDIASFSALAENTPPAELVALMNVYLSAMTDIIEAHGGFVDKYVGDAIVAVFGAPVADDDHAAMAVRAALACCRRLAELNRSAPALQDRALAHRIGLNSGEALVGNIGSGRRFNYTVIGDVVNLASRLEGANKYYGTSILASEATANLTGTAVRWREIDTVKVLGRAQPLRVYEPLAQASEESPLKSQNAQVYGEALAHWRKREFAAAAQAFARIADGDPPARLFMARARKLVQSPPPPDWQPISVLEAK